MRTTGPHNGAKVALFLGDRIISILRDDDPGIPFPDMWDLPGGGRENGETPFETLARELHEELGLVLPADAVTWRRAFPSNTNPEQWNAFFVAQMPSDALGDIIFGNEGQRWALYSLDAFLTLDNVVHYYAPRLTLWLKETGGLPES